MIYLMIFPLLRANSFIVMIKVIINANIFIGVLEIIDKTYILTRTRTI